MKTSHIVQLLLAAFSVLGFANDSSSLVVGKWQFTDLYFPNGTAGYEIPEAEMKLARQSLTDYKLWFNSNGTFSNSIDAENNLLADANGTWKLLNGGRVLEMTDDAAGTTNQFQLARLTTTAMHWEWDYQGLRCGFRFTRIPN